MLAAVEKAVDTRLTAWGAVVSGESPKRVESGFKRVLGRRGTGLTGEMVGGRVCP